MKISEDVQKVMAELQKSVDAKGAIDLVFMLREIVKLFERVKAGLASTDEEERSNIFSAMRQLHSFLMSENKRLADNSGISEEQMLRFAENPDNFSREQWALMKEVKSKMGQQSSEIRSILQKITSPEESNSPSLKKKGASKAIAKKALKKSHMKA